MGLRDLLNIPSAVNVGGGLADLLKIIYKDYLSSKDKVDRDKDKVNNKNKISESKD